MVVHGRGALGRFAGPLGGRIGAVSVGGSVDVGGDTGVVVGVDDGPSDRGAAVEVVQGVSADGGGAEGTSHAHVSGEMDFGGWEDVGEDVA